MIRQKGFTLVEVLVYAAGLVLILGGMTSFLYYAYDWYRTATVGPRADQTGIYMVSRIENDLRAANTINSGSFATTSGTISVTDTIGSVSTTTLYYLSGGRIAYQLNGGSVSYISPSDVTVSKFWLNQITTLNSTAVRFEVDVDYATRQGTTTGVYTGLAILRQSYQ